jgi:hypothetical protein
MRKGIVVDVTAADRARLRMAKAAGISVSSVQRIWRAHGLQPHRMRRFKLSKDPEFVPKLREIVGLYVNPPRHAVVLSVAGQDDVGHPVDVNRHC